MFKDILPWQPPARRIFISYRREDSQWVAGRLADSLAAYFGDKRVFRDIEGIAGGADFGAVIHDTLGSADAVIVLIGKDWLDIRDAHGNPRLRDPADWVGQEVAAALAKGVPVYPVLVEDTPMPRADELPEPLRPLTRFNALALSDIRWEGDVARLAKIISLDIPSATERRLQAINILIAMLLFLAMAFTVSVLVWNLLHVQLAAEDPPFAGWQFSHLFDIGNDKGECRFPPPTSLALLDTWQSGVIFLVLVPASALMFVYGRHVDPARRPYFLAAAWLAALGAFTAFMLFLPVCVEYEPIVIFQIGMIVAPLVLALMSMSGFRAK